MKSFIDKVSHRYIIGYLNRYIVRKDMQITLEKKFETIECQSLSKEKL